MKKFTRDETVKILHESRIAYREKLAGRVFAVIYQDVLPQDIRDAMK